MISLPDAKKVAAMLSAVGEPTRMLVLHHLSAGPLHVGALADVVGVPLVNMSHHLGVMRKAGLLEDEKDGRHVFYRVHPDVLAPAAVPGVLLNLNFGPYRVYLRKFDKTTVAGKKAQGEQEKPAKRGRGRPRTKNVE